MNSGDFLEHIFCGGLVTVFLSVISYWARRTAAAWSSALISIVLSAIYFFTPLQNWVLKNLGTLATSLVERGTALTSFAAWAIGSALVAAAIRNRWR